MKRWEDIIQDFGIKSYGDLLRKVKSMHFVPIKQSSVKVTVDNINNNYGDTYAFTHQATAS